MSSIRIFVFLQIKYHGLNPWYLVLNKNTKQILTAVSYDFLLAERSTSNPNTKIYVGFGWMKIVSNLKR